MPIAEARHRIGRQAQQRVLAEQRAREQVGDEADRAGDADAADGAAPAQAQGDHQQEAQVGTEAGRQEARQRALERERHRAQPEQREHPLHEPGRAGAASPSSAR